MPKILLEEHRHVEEARETWESGVIGGVMFDRGYQVRFLNCQALVWVLHLKLDLNRLPPSSMNVAKFIMQLIVDSIPHPGIEPDTSPCGVISQVKGLLGSSRSIKDLSSIMKGPISLDNKGG